MTKLMKENPDVVKALKAIKDFLKDDTDALASFFGTNLTCAKVLGEFILENHDLKKIPREIQYMLALTWNQYAAIFSPDMILPGMYNPDYQQYFESGDIDDRFANVVKQLYHICKEEKLL